MRAHRFALLLALGLLAPQVTMATDRQATPSPDPGDLPAGVTIDRLIEATLDRTDLPPSLDTLALTGLILLPGAAVTASNGMHLFFVEAGTLTVLEYAELPPTGIGTPSTPIQFVPAGPPITYGAGEQFLASDVATAPPTIANKGEEPAASLVVSIAATGDADIADVLTGSADVYPLAVEVAARVGPPLFLAGGLDAEPLAVALERRSYERAEADPSVTPPFENAAPAARLLAGLAGTVDVRVSNPALYRPDSAAPQALPSDAQISLRPDDQLLVLAPGRIGIRSLVDVPSEVLILSVGTAPATTTRGWRGAEGP